MGKISGMKKNLFSYLASKRSELKDLRFKDILLAKAVVDIHRHTKHTQFRMLALSQIQPIHAIDRRNALDSVRHRMRILRRRRSEILNKKHLSKQEMLNYLPSVSGIKVVKVNDCYISFEGNGRVEAFKRVFKANEEIYLEAEVFEVDDPQKIMRRINRVRKRNFAASP